jgi:hypothetical protein
MQAHTLVDGVVASELTESAAQRHGDDWFCFVELIVGDVVAHDMDALPAFLDRNRIVTMVVQMETSTIVSSAETQC